MCSTRGLCLATARIGLRTGLYIGIGAIKKIDLPTSAIYGTISGTIKGLVETLLHVCTPDVTHVEVLADEAERSLNRAVTLIEIDDAVAGADVAIDRLKCFSDRHVFSFTVQIVGFAVAFLMAKILTNAIEDECGSKFFSCPENFTGRDAVLLSILNELAYRSLIAAAKNTQDCYLYLRGSRVS